MLHDFERTAAAMVAGTQKAIAAAVEPLLKRIEELEARKPEKGDPGKDAVTPTLKAIWEEAQPEAEKIIREAVAAAVAKIPTPKDGTDGRGIKDLLIDRDGQLVATMSDGEMKTLGPVIGKDGSPGQPGKDGRDGFSLDDFDIKRGDDQRTLIFCFEGKDGGYEYEMTLQHPIYCGVFKEGQEYMPGDMVTWGGSLWHCNAETKEKPEAGPWTLAVKKGRDGKDAKNG